MVGLIASAKLQGGEKEKGRGGAMGEVGEEGILSRFLEIISGDAVDEIR